LFIPAAIIPIAGRQADFGFENFVPLRLGSLILGYREQYLQTLAWGNGVGRIHVGS